MITIERLIEQDIHCSVDYMVSILESHLVINFDDFSNNYKFECPECFTTHIASYHSGAIRINCKKCGYAFDVLDIELEEVEFMQYYYISERLAEILKADGQPILWKVSDMAEELDYPIWARTTCNKSLETDGCLQRAVKIINE